MNHPDDWEPASDPNTGADAAGGRYAIVYDGECGICRRSVERLRDWDRHHRFEMVPFQAEGVADRFPDIEESEFRQAVQLISPDGRRWSGADAVERALALTPRGRPIAWLFKLPFARPIARRAYRWIARNRSKLARFF